MNTNILKNERFMLLIAVFLVFLAFASLGRFGTNPSSRFMLTKDIVLYHQLNLTKQDVDFYSGLDYSIKDGNYFSDKPPGFSFLTAPLYLAGDYLYKIGINLPRTDTFNYGGDGNAFFLMIIFVVIFNAIGSVKFYDVIRLLKFNKKIALVTTLIFTFATLYFVYSYNLFLHSFIASLLIFTTYYFLKGKKNDLLASGLFLGFAILCDYTLILIVPFFILYLSRSKNFIPRSFYFLLLLVFQLGLLGLYNLFAFGSLFRFSYMYSTFVDTQKFDHPLFTGLYELLISNWRGLFFYTPILLLSIPGFFLLQRNFKKESYLFMLSFLLYLFLFATYRYLSGGLSYGPRHLVTVLPFFAFFLAPCFDKQYFKRIEEIGLNARFYFSVVIVLLGISFFHTFLGIYVTLEAAPEIDMNPIYNYSLPSFLRGDKESFLLKNHPQVYFLLLFLAIILFILIFRRVAKSHN
jgi:hypothetical protein